MKTIIRVTNSVSKSVCTNLDVDRRTVWIHKIFDGFGRLMQLTGVNAKDIVVFSERDGAVA